MLCSQFIMLPPSGQKKGCFFHIPLLSGCCFLGLLFNLKSLLSSRWWLDRPRAGRLWAAGYHERHGWADLCHLPGPDVLPPRRDPLGLRVSPRRLPVALWKICGRFRLLRQGGQNQNPAPLQAVPATEPAVAGVTLQGWQGGREGPREDATRRDLQGGGEGARKGTHER